jgi:LppX_LprAFG lipoprotein
MRPFWPLAALIVLAAAGCGGGDSASSDDIAGAATKTAKAGSLEAEFDLSGQGLNGNGSGVFNTGKSRSGQLSMKVNANGRQVPVDTIITGNVFYMRSPVFAQVLSGSKQWIKLDLVALAEQRGVDLSSLLDASPTPANALAYLQGARDVEKVGTNTVEGVKTTHYQVTVDLERAAARAKGSERQALRRVISQSKLKTLPLEVWIDGKDYIRRVSYQEHAGQQQAAHVTMELHDFGAPVSIKPPPSESVIDLQQALQQGGR